MPEIVEKIPEKPVEDTKNSFEVSNITEKSKESDLIAKGDVVTIEINKELYEKYISLTNFHKIDLNKFIEIGLKLFLKLEYYWFGESN